MASLQAAPRRALASYRPLCAAVLSPSHYASIHTSRHVSGTATATILRDSPHEYLRPLEEETPTTHPKQAQLSPELRHFLDSALRVNQAGELAAVLIYSAQNPIVVRSHPHLRTLMQHMYDQEAGHFKTFNALLAKHRIRPTIMYPIWRVAATALGWSTAVMGREAAMACTEAVETEIGDHYNNQVRVLLAWEKEVVAKGEDIGPEMKHLLSTLRRIRDEELEHLDHAVENDAKEAKPYELLTNVIRGGCRAAIWVSEKI